MIASVCLNPSIDRTLYLDTLTLGGTNHVQRVIDNPGGKGINTAIACSRLGIEASLYGFLYDENPEAIASVLEKEGVHVKCDMRKGKARLNIKLRIDSRKDITEVNLPGAFVPQDEIDAVVDKVIEASRGLHMLLLTGSLPPGCSPDFYARIAAGSKAPVILDTTGESLRLGIRSGKIHLIKPNLFELEGITGRKLYSLDDVKGAAIECTRMGVKYVVVSLGEYGAIITNGVECYHCPAIPVTVGSTVGAGDCMVAGITYSFTQTNDDLPTTLRRAVAAGTAGTITEGTDLLYMDDFNFFFNKTNIIDLRD